MPTILSGNRRKVPLLRELDKELDTAFAIAEWILIFSIGYVLIRHFLK